MITQTARDSQQTNNVAPWVSRGGPAIATIALVTYVTAYAHWPTLRTQVDAMVYRFAAERLLAGLDLYSTGLTGKPGELLFIYPPLPILAESQSMSRRTNRRTEIRGRLSLGLRHPAHRGVLLVLGWGIMIGGIQGQAP